MTPFIRTETILFDDGTSKMVDYSIVFHKPPTLPQPSAEDKVAIKKNLVGIIDIEYCYFTLEECML